MIGEIAQDLLTKVKSVTDFGSPSRVSFTVGGRTIDPAMTKITLPACWVVYPGDDNIDEDQNGQCGSFLQEHFVVNVILEYGTETKLLTVDFPLLEKVKNAVNGTNGPLSSMKWKYEGQGMQELTDTRMIYEQRYSILSI